MSKSNRGGAVTLVLAAGFLSACEESPAMVMTPVVSPGVVVVDGRTAPASRQVLVVPEKRLSRPTEIVGVLDFHSAATDENKGFDELAARAAALGADAVIGAEFEHGGAGEPSHLSGMAVRYRDP